MKKIIFNSTIGLFLVTLFSCSKTENQTCTFGKSTFENKTYKPSLIKVESNGVDVTSTIGAMITSDPCFINTITLNSSGNFTENKDSKCTDPTENGTWKVYSSNNKNYFVFEKDTAEVISFDCNSMTFKRLESSFSITGKLTKI
jgi:hypothetical protein